MTDDALYTLTPYRPVSPDKPAKGNGVDEAPLPKLIPLEFVKGEIVAARMDRPSLDPKSNRHLGAGERRRRQDAPDAAATDKLRCGAPVDRPHGRGCISIGVYTEDKDRDLKERQAAINAAYCLEETPSNMHLFPRLGLENELVEFDGAGKPKLTKFFHQVHEAAFDLHAGLVVLDVLVDLFGGDESGAARCGPSCARFSAWRPTSTRRWS